MSPSLRSRHRVSLIDLTGYIVILAVGVPALWLHFSAGHPNRWIALGILLTFAALSLLHDQLMPQRDSLLAHLYMAVQTVLIVALGLLDPQYFGAIILFFMLSPQVMMMFSTGVAYAWLGIFAIVTAGTIRATEGREGLVILPIYVAGYIFFALFARQTAEANDARQDSQRLLEELQEAHRQLQDYAAKVETLAVAEERNRLAREMHDTLGHRLTVSSVQLQAVERLITSDPHRASEHARDGWGRGYAETARAMAQGTGHHPKHLR